MKPISIGTHGSLLLVQQPALKIFPDVSKRLNTKTLLSGMLGFFSDWVELRPLSLFGAVVWFLNIENRIGLILLFILGGGKCKSQVSVLAQWYEK